MELKLLNSASQDQLEEIGQLRTLVWTGESDVNPHALGPKPWIDPVDQSAYQWTIKDHGRLVAAARLTVHSDLDSIPYQAAFRDRLPESIMYGAMNRLVVLPDYRGQGLARRLDCLRLQHAAQIGAELVVVVASGQRVLALESLGFQNLGEPNQTPELLRTQQPYSILIHRLREIPSVPEQG